MPTNPHSRRRATGRPAVAVLAACSLLAAGRAQEQIRLVQVPERLVLPAPPGSNLLLEVEVPGQPTAVWLGARGVADRVPLEPVGDGRHQLNLADRRVAGLLRVEERQLVVFADVDGRRLHSPWVAFRRPPMAAGMTCSVRRIGAPAAVPILPDGACWLDPAEIDRIDVDPDGSDVVLMAHMGSTDHPLRRDPDTERWTLPLGDEDRQAWQQHGSLLIVAHRGGEAEVGFELRAVPATLQAPPEGLPFVVGQRQRAEVPGTRGWLRVALDDITHGQVLLTIEGADGRVLVPQCSVRDGDTVALPLRAGAAVLRVEVLKNLLIGEDFAELRVVQADAAAQDRIEGLLRRIAASDCEFVREERSHDGAAAATHLRWKLSSLPQRPTVDEFIERVASRSSATGRDYVVQRPDGTRTTMREWLRLALQDLDREAAERAADHRAPTDRTRDR